MKSLFPLGLLAPILLFLTGCGGSGSSTKPSDEPAALELKKISAEKLPKLADYLPPLPPGENLIEVAPPEGWSIKQKNMAYLCAFTKEKGSQVPAIVVKQAVASVEDFDSVTPENVVEFTTQMQATLATDKSLLEEAQPMVIGGNAFARYVKKASLDNLPAEVQVLATQQDGRLFTVELRVRPGNLLKIRDEAYAVAGGLKFPSSAATPEAPAVETTEPKPEPAPEKPAE